LGFCLVACAQTFLLPCGAVFAIVNLTASEHYESVLHSCLFSLDTN
jgi:hypothetical protein